MERISPGLCGLGMHDRRELKEKEEEKLGLVSRERLPSLWAAVL